MKTENLLYWGELNAIPSKDTKNFIKIIKELFPDVCNTEEDVKYYWESLPKDIRGNIFMWGLDSEEKKWVNVFFTNEYRVRPKVLICNNCKEYHVAPRTRCDYCGSTTLTKTHQSNINKVAIKVNKIAPHKFEAFAPDDTSLGFLNNFEFLDLRYQIKLKQVEGYYIKISGNKYYIHSDGMVDELPDGAYNQEKILVSKLLN